MANPNDAKVTWVYSSTRDVERAEGTLDDLKIMIDDCDGDLSRWEVSRAGVFLAMGESISQVPYHFEHAMTLAEAISSRCLPRHG